MTSRTPDSSIAETRGLQRVEGQFEIPKDLPFRSAASPCEESAVAVPGSKADSSPINLASDLQGVGLFLSKLHYYPAAKQSALRQAGFLERSHGDRFQLNFNSPKPLRDQVVDPGADGTEHEPHRPIEKRCEDSQDQQNRSTDGADRGVSAAGLLCRHTGQPGNQGKRNEEQTHTPVQDSH